MSDECRRRPPKTRRRSALNLLPGDAINPALAFSSKTIVSQLPIHGFNVDFDPRFPLHNFVLREHVRYHYDCTLFHLGKAKALNTSNERRISKTEKCLRQRSVNPLQFELASLCASKRLLLASWFRLSITCGEERKRGLLEGSRPELVAFYPI
jgi:hypothetical protein